MLKGKSVIELRNAKTGELEQKIEDENLVTNAVYNLANPPNLVKRVLGKESGFVEMPFIMTPLATTCLQGLMLFDKNIVEDVNNIIPNASELNQVGCASTSTQNTMPYRGTLNEAETVDITNGRRFVWDFATDKGNGTIKSVCLTSPAGGFFGSDVGANGMDIGINPGGRFRGLNAGAQSEVLKSNTSSRKIGQSGTLIEGVGKFTRPIGSFEENTFLFLEPVENGPTSYNFLKITLDYSKLSLKSRGVNVETQHTVTTGGAKLSLYPMADDHYIYSFFYKTANSFDFVKINALTLEIEEERTVVVQDAVFYQGNCGIQGTVCDGHFYVSNSYSYSAGKSSYYYASGIYIIDMNDHSDYKYIDLITEGIITSRDLIYIQLYNGVVGISKYYHSADANGTSEVYILSAKEIKKTRWYYYTSSSSYANKDFILPSPWIPKPFLLGSAFVSNSDLYRGVSFGFDICYMATINNLSTPVVKNETQTMKVTYEITEV